MYKADGEAGTGSAQGMKRHEEPDFGFALDVPRRFIGLANTVDPVAQMMRGGAAKAGRDGGGTLWPMGLCDPQVLGDFGGGRVQPVRFLEFDVRTRKTPLPADEAAEFWFEARQMMPMALASAELPGYRLLDVRGDTLGPLDALAFEWRCDGLNPGDQGGDHALLLWAPHSRRAFNVYYHCCDDQWAARAPELRSILDSFEVLS
jgi:hypothetical protein